MSKQTVNLSANEVLEHLNLVMPARCFAEAKEVDTVCVNTPAFNLGWIVTLEICGHAGYSFTVFEFACDTEFGNDFEQNDTFLTYEEALDHIRARFAHFTSDE